VATVTNKTLLQFHSLPPLRCDYETDSNRINSSMFFYYFKVCFEGLESLKVLKVEI